jgi:hypothetical protein
VRVLKEIASRRRTLASQTSSPSVCRKLCEKGLAISIQVDGNPAYFLVTDAGKSVIADAVKEAVHA